MTKIESFLKALRESDFFIKSIYLNGGCYQLYKVIKTVFPDAKPYLNNYFAHVCTMVDGKLYDITGRIKVADNNEFRLMTDDEMKEAESWSFAKNNDLYYVECPVCGEPIKINREKLI